MELNDPWREAMLSGDFEAAWQHTDRLEAERRRNKDRFAWIAQPHLLRWDGQPLHGNRVVIRCLHGLGDTLQFVRYLPVLRKMARSTLTLVQPDLLPLLCTTDSLGPIVNGWTDEPLPEHDVELEIMELPYAFRSLPSTVPSAVPYIDISAVREAVPKQLVHVPKTLRIGFQPTSSAWNSARSLPSELVGKIASSIDREQVEVYSLSADNNPAISIDSDSLKMPPSSTSEILKLAAFMLEMDLIISVDTMAAHLAGALGLHVWILLLNESDWRWQRTGETSCWYPTMRLFRQRKKGDWESVAEQVLLNLQSYKSHP